MGSVAGDDRGAEVGAEAEWLSRKWKRRLQHAFLESVKRKKGQDLAWRSRAISVE